MVTKNEMAAIIAALTTDYDTPPSEKAARPDSVEAQNDAYIEVAEPDYIEHRKRAV